MNEQYIYTRTNTGGHEIAFRTPGIDGPLKADAAAAAGYKGETLDADGRPVPVLVKRNLRNCPDTVVLQQSVQFPPKTQAAAESGRSEELLRMSSTFRAQILSHGYACPLDGADILNPDLWFDLPFVDWNVNLKAPVLAAAEELPVSDVPLRPLMEVLADAGLSLDQFISAVRSTFDTENEPTILLIELDFTRPGAQALGAQLLRWMFHFLPYGMRRQADFSTCYDYSCGGSEYCLALVSSALVTEGRTGITIKRAPAGVTNGFLFARGTCAHRSGPGSHDFDASESLYARWLEKVIRITAAEEPETQRFYLDTLDDIYACFDAYVGGQPGKKQTDTAVYDALCWVYGNSELYPSNRPRLYLADQALDSFQADPVEMIRVLLDLSDRPMLTEQAPCLRKVLLDTLRSGYTDNKMELYCRLSREAGSAGDDEQALLDLFLARLLDGAGEASGLGGALERYFSLRGQADDAPAFAALERVLYPEERPPAEQALLASYGAECTAERGRARMTLWCRCMMGEEAEFDRFLERQARTAEVLAQMRPEHAEDLLRPEVLLKGRVLPHDPDSISLVCLSWDRLNSRLSKTAAAAADPLYRLEIRCMLRDNQSDPDGILKRVKSGTMTVPDALLALETAFGREERQNRNGFTAWIWFANGVLAAVPPLSAEGGNTVPAERLISLLGTDPDLHRMVCGRIAALCGTAGFRGNSAGSDALRRLYEWTVQYLLMPPAARPEPGSGILSLRN